MRSIVHLSDIHFGRLNDHVVEPLIKKIETLAPDLVAVSGDLTQRARSHQFKEARAFLDRLWRRGMLDGATPDAAYSVRCDETTNPPEETARGRVICEVGVLPPWPAEFVVVRIGRTEGATEILERET